MGNRDMRQTPNTGRSVHMYNKKYGVEGQDLGGPLEPTTSSIDGQNGDCENTRPFLATEKVCQMTESKLREVVEGTYSMRIWSPVYAIVFRRCLPLSKRQRFRFFVSRSRS